MKRAAKGRRPGFTLIELMIVITIIVVLVAILVPAVIKVLGLGNQTVAQTEVRKLEAAVSQFQSQFHVSYMPSMVKLCKYYSDYNVSAPGLDRDSVEFLLKLFPKCKNTWTNQGINWHPSWASVNGTGSPPSAPTATAMLEGHQCLVFFLGGIPTVSPNGVQGFATDPSNPANPTNLANGSVITPFFDFQSSGRLVQLGGASNPFFSYLDPYKNNVSADSPPSNYGLPASCTKIGVYVYFSSYKARNGYARYTAQTTGGSPVTYVLDNNSIAQYNNSSSTPPFGIQPYVLSGSSPTQFLNADTFQIISAGADGYFGPGGNWTANGTGTPPDGRDDLTNFTPGLLGKGQ